MLFETKKQVVISYLTPDRAVYDLSELSDKVFRPIDLLETIRFTDGTSLKAAYEADPEKDRRGKASRRQIFRIRHQQTSESL